jgi:hypothetical protein
MCKREREAEIAKGVIEAEKGWELLYIYNKENKLTRSEGKRKRREKKRIGGR